MKKREGKGINLTASKTTSVNAAQIERERRKNEKCSNMSWSHRSNGLRPESISGSKLKFVKVLSLPFNMDWGQTAKHFNKWNIKSFGGS